MYKQTNTPRLYYNTSDGFIYALKIGIKITEDYLPISSELIKIVKADGLERLLK